MAEFKSCIRRLSRSFIFNRRTSSFISSTSLTLFGDIYSDLVNGLGFLNIRLKRLRIAWRLYPNSAMLEGEIVGDPTWGHQLLNIC